MNTVPARDIRVLVVDDEAPARRLLTDLLRQDAEIGTILQASDGREAVRMIRAEKPALVFLDVQMPELDGLGVVTEVGAANMPLTVFVTAHDQHAIRAFETNALDYLLKPFSDERLEASLARAKARLSEQHVQAFGQSVLQVIAAQKPPSAWLDRLVVRTGATTQFVRTADIDWIEAAGVYATLHAGGKEHLYRAALTELAERLDPARFVRIHRSAIVNIDAIAQLVAVSHGEFDVVFQNGTRTRASRTYRAALEKRVGQRL